MDINFIKPTIFVSKCLGFAKCRWNGEVISDKFIKSLRPHIDYITTCPECEIGLGVPRDPIRIIYKDHNSKLKQLNTGDDFTDKMNSFVNSYLDKIDEIDGFILKERSPSCGLKDVKVYSSLKPSSPMKRSSGFFGKEVLDRFPNFPAETEMRLTNFTIRENFLTKIFTFAKFRKLKKKPAIKDLIQFHAENKLLLMAYSQKYLKIMGNIVANHEKRKIEDIFSEYESNLCLALTNLHTFSSSINVLMHAFGYFSKELNSGEKKFFLNTLEEYRREQIPLSVPVSLVRSYIIRFNQDYLRQQTFFQPYPESLIEIKDSGKGRSYK